MYTNTFKAQSCRLVCMTRDYKQESLTSPLSYRILRNIAEAEGTTYPSKVAEDLGSTYQTVNNYMRGLRKWGLIKRSKKEGKKQYYEIDYNAFNELFVNLWCSRSRENSENFEKLLSEYKDFGEFQSVEEMSEKFNSLLQRYIFHYLRKYEESTIDEMIYEDFYMSFPTDSDKKWVKSFIILLENIRGSSYQGDEAMKNSIEDIQGKEIENYADNIFKDISSNLS